MSQIQHVELIDDMDGTPAEHTINFGLDGHEYVIDLSGRNAGALRKTFALYTGRARKITAARSNGKPVGRSTESRQYSAKVRDWARSTGRIVSERGRIPGQVVTEYEAAQGAEIARGLAAKFVPPGSANVTVTRNGPAARGAAKASQTVGRARVPRTAPEPPQTPTPPVRRGRSVSPANVTRRAGRGGRRPRE